MRPPTSFAAGLLAAALVIPLWPALSVGAELPLPLYDTTPVAAAGRRINVKAGDDFQAALDLAQPGDVISLEAGAPFTGNFTLPNKTGDGWIVIRTSAPDGNLPAPGTRLTPSHACVLPKIVSRNTEPALTAAPGAHHYLFVGVEVTVAPDVPINYNLIVLGARATSLADVPHDLVFDRVYIHGQPQVNVRRGIALNSASTVVTDSYISDIHEVGADSQAIAGWNGPGPFRIVNNHLEAAGENLLFGGADPSLPGLVPADIEILGNHFFKPLAWRVEDPSYAGTPWTVKNLLELKNARRLLIDGNLFEHNWAHAQGGTAVLFTVRNQDGTAPWSVVEDVTFTNNIVRHTGSAVGMHGWDDLFPSQPTRRILIRNNLFADVSGARWGGAGRLFNAFKGIEDLVIEHNTGLQDGSIIYADGGTHTRFVFRNNLVRHNEYGVHGTGTNVGLDSLNAYFPGYVFARNVLVGGTPALYPPGDFFPASLDDVGFVDLAGGDYRLSTSSPYKNGGTDGKDIGVDIDALQAASGGSPDQACPSVCGPWLMTPQGGVQPLPPVKSRCPANRPADGSSSVPRLRGRASPTGTGTDRVHVDGARSVDPGPPPPR